jgi:hypothetical protein
VTHDGGRLHALGTPGGRQRHHDGEHHRLHVVDPLRAQGATRRRPRRLLAQERDDVEVEVRPERAGALTHRAGEDGRGVEQLDGHAGPLPALAGEHEHRAQRCLDDTACRLRRAVGHPPQLGNRVVARRHQPDPVPEG